MEPMTTSCPGMEAKLATLLLEPEEAPAKVRAHVESCAGCRAELAALHSTMELLDGWELPEPNPYFLTRMNARLDEERRAEPSGRLARWFSGLRAGFAYGPRLHARPLAAMALTVVLLVGGGAYLEFNNTDQQPVGHDAAVVHDLQNLDSNAQLLDQLEALSSSQDGD